VTTALEGHNGSPKQPYITVFLVDDHPLVRQGLALMLEQAGFAAGGEADSNNSALDHTGLRAAQVVVLDITLGQASGLDLIPELRRMDLEVVIYSINEDPAFVGRALAAGAAGYVTKRETAQSLVEAVRTVAAGGRYVSPRAAAALPSHISEWGVPDF